MTQPLHPPCNSNDSARQWFYESAIDIDDSNHELSNDIDHSPDTIETNEKSRVTTVSTIDDALTGDNYTITDDTLEGIGSLQQQYSVIISDCIKTVFCISNPKDW